MTFLSLTETNRALLSELASAQADISKNLADLKAHSKLHSIYNEQTTNYKNESLSLSKLRSIINEDINNNIIEPRMIHTATQLISKITEKLHSFAYAEKCASKINNTDYENELKEITKKLEEALSISHQILSEVESPNNQIDCIEQMKNIINISKDNCYISHVVKDLNNSYENMISKTIKMTNEINELRFSTVDCYLTSSPSGSKPS